ncbi:hypothetical protein ACHQM5_024863 [Ranunculus cassubicifolius]
MDYYGRRNSSIFDVFTLNPLPYPVILILLVIFVFLGTSFYLNYESVVEEAEESLSLVIKVVPIVLVILVTWLSSMENTDWLFGRSPYDRRRATHHQPPPEGTSPWGVALLIVLLLVMISFQSSLQEMFS